MVLVALLSEQAVAQSGSLAPELLERIAKAYSIEVVYTGQVFPVTTRSGEIAGACPSLEVVDQYAPLFAQEFGLYPAELIKAAKLRRIVFCVDLHFAGQRRNAIPDFEHDTLYLDVKRGDHHRAYLRKVIHHEFFHMIDLRDDGKLYGDERWSALNPEGHRYGDGGRNSQTNSRTSVLTSEASGFLNHYSTTGVEEDKAEVFANLLVEPEEVAKRAAADKILEAKIAAMQKLLAEFCPQVNDSFWRTARATKRDERR